MKKRYLQFVFIIACVTNIYAQRNFNNVYEPYFKEAYQLFPSVPKGVLEAVADANTHMRHIIPTTEEESCSGMPYYFGVMGLVEDGKGVFKNNLQTIAQLSGYDITDIKTNPRINILAYAAAYQSIYKKQKIKSNNITAHLPILKALSELPLAEGSNKQFPQDAQLFSILQFLNNPSLQQFFEMPHYDIDIVKIFGKQNFEILSSPFITAEGDCISNKAGTTYKAISTGPCADAPGIIWVTSPNFSSRAGTTISAVTIHTTQGSYAGSISWFQNTSSQVSAHYVIRSSDGQVTQMVCEADKAWHVGNENPYTIGIEHEGYIADATWYSSAMYNASAAIVRDIVNSGYGINPLRTYHGLGCNGSSSTCGLGACTKIKGHQQFPNQSHTDPGQYWNWDLYYNLINNNPTISVQTASTGVVYDLGGASADYANDVRQVVRITPPNATSITLTINSFNTEANYDYLYIYKGSSYTDSLIGRFSGTSIPSTITTNGSALLLDFRSDCATTAPGFQITWNATVIDVTAPTSSITAPTWVTANFNPTFTDADNSGGSGIDKAFYQVSDYNGSYWTANNNNGFINETFAGTAINTALWTSASGVWALTSGALIQTDEANSNSNIYCPLTQNLSNIYLYHWKGKISGTGTNKRAGLHFFCNTPTAANRGISYFVYMRDDGDKVQFYEVDASDVFTLVKEVPFSINTNQTYDYKLIYDRIVGKMTLYIDNVLVTDWTDTTPISNGTYVSFRSGNCAWTVDDFRVYRSRTSTPTVTVGTTTSDIRYQNPNSTTTALNIRSIVKDVAGNISTESLAAKNVDWTAPVVPIITNENIVYDSINNKYTITLAWNASSDANSGISKYYIKIGTTPGGSNLIPLTNLGNVTSSTQSNLTLTSGATYYQTIIAENGAGLQSLGAGSGGVTAGCASPTNLTETNLTATSVKLNWTKVSNAVQYRVRIKKSTVTSYTTYLITSNNKSLTNLVANTTYNWSVRTLCSNGTWKAYSATKNFTTPATLSGEINIDELLASATDESEIISMELQPNISNGNNCKLIFSDEVTDAPLIISNMSGGVVFKTSLNGSEYDIDCANYPSGIYFVSVQLQQGILTQKLVIQRY